MEWNWDCDQGHAPPHRTALDSDVLEVPRDAEEAFLERRSSELIMEGMGPEPHAS